MLRRNGVCSARPQRTRIGESIVSILWKFARANGVPAHTLIQLMKVGIDPYEGLEPMRDVWI